MSRRERYVVGVSVALVLHAVAWWLAQPRDPMDHAWF